MSPRPARLEDPGGDLFPRLASAAAEVADAQVLLNIAMERRNELIVQAADEGMGYGRIREATGLSKPYISRVCGESQPDAVSLLEPGGGS